MAVSQQKKKATQESFLDMTPQDSAINGRGKNELSEEFLLNFLNSIQAMAVGCIDDFFHNEKLYCGGDIEQDRLHCHSYISMVMNTDISTSVDRAYLSLSRCPQSPSLSRQCDFVMAILNRCAKMNIPKCFAGGILLMYMELVGGISVTEELVAA